MPDISTIVPGSRRTRKLLGTTVAEPLPFGSGQAGVSQYPNPGRPGIVHAPTGDVIITNVCAALLPPTPDILRRVFRIQLFTIIWMTAEAAISLGAAWVAHSPALLAFGGDSAIELISAVVVLWRFRSRSVPSQPEEWAFRIAGSLLFALAGYVVVASSLVLRGYR